jgi:hypothetical protein
MPDYFSIAVQWLLAPIVSATVLGREPAYMVHGALMIVSMVLCLPIGAVIARYFKVTPKQNWPIELDSKFWWYCHLVFSYLGLFASILAMAAIFSTWRVFDLETVSRLNTAQLLHLVIGWATLLLCCFIIFTAWFRGTKGGPGEKNIRGDHYDLTPRRLLFESIHKKSSYLFFLLCIFCIGGGLLLIGAKGWMLVVLAFLFLCSVLWIMRLELKGRRIPSYPATWGLRPEHPGNRRRYTKDRLF